MHGREPRYARQQIEPSFIPLRIIPVKQKNPPLSDDCRAVSDSLRELLQRAEEGKIHGLCFSIVNEDHTYEAECVGSYDRFPTDALGPLEVLKLKLTRKALDEQWNNNNS